MKLTKIQEKIEDSISNSIYHKFYGKTHDSISFDIWIKIINEIWAPNWESIGRMQRTTLNNLKNEIN